MGLGRGMSYVLNGANERGHRRLLRRAPAESEIAYLGRDGATRLVEGNGGHTRVRVRR